MPPKLTPHQFSRGLTYVKKVPTFLQGLVDDDDNDRGETSDRLPTTNEDLTDNEDDEILKLSGDEKPQIVVLNEKKHMSKDEVQEFIGTRKKKSKLTDDESSQNEDRDSQGGKIIFRKPDRKEMSAHNNKLKASSKAKLDTSIKDLNEVIHGIKRERASKDESDANEKSTKKTKRKKKMNNLLSFNSDVV